MSTLLINAFLTSINETDDKSALKDIDTQLRLLRRAVRLRYDILDFQNVPLPDMIRITDTVKKIQTIKQIRRHCRHISTGEGLGLKEVKNIADQTHALDITTFSYDQRLTFRKMLETLHTSWEECNDTTYPFYAVIYSEPKPEVY